MKRGQAAMEFLMTYGWAILVVLVVIGALAYFGILNPLTLLPERCELEMGFYCRDHLITTTAAGDTGDILFYLENGKGEDVKIANITAINTKYGWVCTLDAGYKNLTLLNGDSREYNLNSTTTTCKILSDMKGKNSKLKWNLEIDWYKLGSTDDYTHTAGGELLSKVE